MRDDEVVWYNMCLWKHLGELCKAKSSKNGHDVCYTTLVWEVHVPNVVLTVVGEVKVQALIERERGRHTIQCHVDLCCRLGDEVVVESC